MSAKPVAWKVYGHRGEFVTLRSEEAYGYTELIGRARKEGHETVTPLYAESPHIARALAIQEAARVIREDESGRDSNGYFAELISALSPAPSVTEESAAAFTEWLCREMPPGTIIGDPKWWAPKIYRKALAALGVEVTK